MTFWLLSEIGRPVRSIPVKVMVAARLATPLIATLIPP